MTVTTPGAAPAVPAPTELPTSAEQAGRGLRMPAHIYEVISAAHAYAADMGCTYDMLLAWVDAAPLTEAAPRERANACVQLSQARAMGRAGTQPSDTPPQVVPPQRLGSDDDPTWMNSTQRALYKIRNL